MRAGRRRSHEPTPGGGSGAGGGNRVEIGGDRHDNYYSAVTTSNSVHMNSNIGSVNTHYQRHMDNHSQVQGPGSGSVQGGSGSQTHSPINPNSKHGLSGMSRSPGLGGNISYEQSIRDNQIREHRDQPAPGIFGLVIPGRKGEGPVQRKALTPRPHHNQSNGNLYMEPPFRERTLSSSTSDSTYITLFKLYVNDDFSVDYGLISTPPLLSSTVPVSLLSTHSLTQSPLSPSLPSLYLLLSPTLPSSHRPPSVTTPVLFPFLIPPTLSYTSSYPLLHLLLFFLPSSLYPLPFSQASSQ
jgi:hypothetical protein